MIRAHFGGKLVDVRISACVANVLSKEMSIGVDMHAPETQGIVPICLHSNFLGGADTSMKEKRSRCCLVSGDRKSVV